MRSEVKRALVIALVSTALMALAVALAASVVLGASARSFAQGQWSGDLLAQHDVPRVFGVKFAAPVSRFRVRALELADASYEVLAELGPGEAGARFVAVNQLTAVASQSDELVELDAALEELLRLTGEAPSSITLYAGPLSPVFERQVRLLRVGDSTWVVLDASAARGAD
jgi:hypothetical protein